MGEALAVGPVFVAIVHQATSRGVSAACRVILGATAVNTALLVPALAFAGVLESTGGLAPWLGLPGAFGFLCVGLAGLRDARRLWRGGKHPGASSGRAFWTGVIGSVANPLVWSLWLATNLPALLHARQVGGPGGLLLFVVTWLGASAGVELALAVAAVRGAGLLGARGQACVSTAAALLFLGLAGQLATSALPYLLA